jgi:hypothetical protein
MMLRYISEVYHIIKTSDRIITIYIVFINYEVQSKRFYLHVY